MASQAWLAPPYGRDVVAVLVMPWKLLDGNSCFFLENTFCGGILLDGKLEGFR